MPFVTLHRTIQFAKRMHVPQMPVTRTIHSFVQHSGIMDLGTSVPRLSRQQITAAAAAEREREAFYSKRSTTLLGQS